MQGFTTSQDWNTRVWARELKESPGLGPSRPCLIVKSSTLKPIRTSELPPRGIAPRSLHPKVLTLIEKNDLGDNIANDAQQNYQQLYHLTVYLRAL